MTNETIKYLRDANEALRASSRRKTITILVLCALLALRIIGNVIHNLQVHW